MSNQLRNTLKSAISNTYTSDIGVKNASQVVRVELNSLLDDIRIIEQPLPDLACNEVYSETCKQIYSEMIEAWIAAGVDIFYLAEYINNAKFGSMTTELSLWSRLLDMSTQVDLFIPKKKWWSRKKRVDWVARVQSMHPLKLEEYKKSNTLMSTQLVTA